MSSVIVQTYISGCENKIIVENFSIDENCTSHIDDVFIVRVIQDFWIYQSSTVAKSLIFCMQRTTTFLSTICIAWSRYFLKKKDKLNWNIHTIEFFQTVFERQSDTSSFDSIGFQASMSSKSTLVCFIPCLNSLRHSWQTLSVILILFACARWKKRPKVACREFIECMLINSFVRTSTNDGNCSWHERSIDVYN
jgi:hypothetical protein